ncbi:hypothetical protein ACFU9F_01780 [Streptomyces zhihengii]|uniref:hypothetical protein n=1 Tax=Streptomyces zhihengii TaxID=1818004 RepID=UPI00368BAAE6
MAGETTGQDQPQGTSWVTRDIVRDHNRSQTGMVVDRYAENVRIATPSGSTWYAKETDLRAPTTEEREAYDLNKAMWIRRHAAARQPGRRTPPDAAPRPR